MPIPRKEQSGWCSCDSTYAKSLQGICKVISLIIGLLTVIIIGASPYSRPLFVLEGVTWPFHVVMLLTALVFVATLVVYSLFLSGQHLEYPQVAWPTVELAFNLTASVMTLIAGAIEASNVWRWDMSRAYYQRNPGSSGSLQVFGYAQGSLTNQLNLNGYCSRYPRDCMDYFSLLSGRSSYHGNHVFASILLFLLLITYLVASFFALRTWRQFKRQMTNGKENTEPSTWDRLRFRMGNLKLVTAVDVRDRFGKLLNRSRDRDAQSVEDGGVEDISDWRKDAYTHVEMKEKPSVHESSVYSGSHKSHRSSRHHHDRSSRSSSSRKHHDDEKRSHRGTRSSRSSRHASSSRSSCRKDDDIPSHRDRKDDAEVLDAKTIGSHPSEGGPVASVMC